METKERQNKEQVILAAAEQEFLTKGYDGARTTSIAKAAGVTHAMLHYYFRTKEQLFKRIVDEKFAAMSESMLTVLGDPSLPIVERIKCGVETHFDFVAANPQLPRFIINEIVSRPERYEILYKRVSVVVDGLYSGLAMDIERETKEGKIEMVDARMLLISILSLNVFTFVAYPIMEPVMGALMADREKFLAERKAENVETILRRIKKQ